MINNNIFFEEFSNAIFHLLSLTSLDETIKCLLASDHARDFIGSGNSCQFIAVYVVESTNAIGVAGSVDEIPQSAKSCVCVFRNRKNANEMASLADLSIYRISLKNLGSEELNNFLSFIYRPLFQRGDVEPYASEQVISLLDAIHSQKVSTGNFNLFSFIHQDIIDVCAKFPEKGISELLNSLGEKIEDPSFLSLVQTQRTKCLSSSFFDFMKRNVRGTCEEISYWENLDLGLDATIFQLKSRGWVLQQQLLKKRGNDTSVENFLLQKKNEVHEAYIFLSAVPFENINCSNFLQLSAAVRAVFEQLSRPNRYLSTRLLDIATYFVKEVCDRVSELGEGYSLFNQKPEHAVVFLNECRTVLTETQNGYIQLHDFIFGGISKAVPHQIIAALLKRINAIQALINKKFLLDLAIRETFVSEHTDTAEKLHNNFEQFGAHQKTIWDVTPSSEEEYCRIMTSYETAVSNIDEIITSTVVEQLDMCTTNEEMFEIYIRFRKVDLPKLRLTLGKKKEKLLSLINDSIEAIKTRYFDEESRFSAVKLGFISGKKPLLSNILWQKSIEHALSTLLHKRDSVSEFSWQQFLSLQTIDFYWILNERFATFLGVELNELKKDPRVELSSPEIYGTAFALAFLDQMYSDEKSDWENRKDVVEARKQLERRDNQAYNVAKTFFRQHRIVARQIVNREKVREFRLLRDRINSGIREDIQKWAATVRTLMSSIQLDRHNILSGPVFAIQGNARICVNFPLEIGGLKNEMDIIFSNNLMTSVGTSGETLDHLEKIQFFLEQNVSRLEVALTLSQLLSSFYAIINDESGDLLLRLLPMDYSQIYSLFVQNACLRWSPFVSVKSFTENLTTAMTSFSDISAEVITAVNVIEDAVETMKSDNRLNTKKVLSRLGAIKKFLNDLSIKSGDIKFYIRTLQPRIDDILTRHLENLILKWMKEYDSLRSDENVFLIQRGALKVLHNSDDSAVVVAQSSQMMSAINYPCGEMLKGWVSRPYFHLSPLKIVTKIMGDNVTFVPDARKCRAFWYDCFNKAVMEWIFSVPHFVDIAGSTHGLPVNSNRRYRTTAVRLMGMLPQGLLAQVFNSIESLIAEIQSYERKFGENQRLYNQPDVVPTAIALLGDNLSQWISAMKEIRENALELQINSSTQPFIPLGGVVIDARVARDCLEGRLANIELSLGQHVKVVLAARLEGIFTSLHNYRNTVEELKISDNSDSGNAILFLEMLVEIEGVLDTTAKEIPLFWQTEFMLQKIGVSLQIIKLGDSPGISASSSPALTEHVGATIKPMKNKPSQQASMAISQWISAEQISSEHSALRDAIDKRKSLIEKNREVLINHLTLACQGLQENTNALEKSYTEISSLEGMSGEGVSEGVLVRVSGICESAKGLNGELKKIQKAQRALKLEDIFHCIKLESIASDLNKLHDALSSAKQVYDSLAKLGSIPFNEVQPRTLYTELVELQNSLLQFSSVSRHFSVYTELTNYIKELLVNQRFVVELRSEVIQERHWVSMKSQLKLRHWVIGRLTLNDVWASKPCEHSAVFWGVINIARSQHRLQIQLDHISEFWSHHPLETICYQNRVILFKGWDALFERLNEDLASLNAMKHSADYADSIAATAHDLEERLIKALYLLELFMDVQRRWVYLSGVFTESAPSSNYGRTTNDPNKGEESSSGASVYIKQRLAAEVSQFEKTSRDFMFIMPCVIKRSTDTEKRRGGLAEGFYITDADADSSPNADVSGEEDSENFVTIFKFIAIEKVNIILERISRELTVIQKSLNNYLEVQRGHFSRFYFIGDDDLLEIIGNGKNPVVVIKHLKKMFTGIASLQLKEMTEKGNKGNEHTQATHSTISGVISPGGEMVSFEPEGSFNVKDTSGAHEWLSRLEKSTEKTLRLFVVKNLQNNLTASMDTTETLLTWLKKYPAQVAALVMQISWCRDVEKELSQGNLTTSVEGLLSQLLSRLAKVILTPGLNAITRFKMEHIITIAVHQRDKSRSLILQGVRDARHYEWLSVMRTYCSTNTIHDKTVSKSHQKTQGNPKNMDIDGSVDCVMADASFVYGYEYYGLSERLVQTMLTDRAFLTLTQALHTGQGGSPSGPAGTGKTETVKALGMQLGRLVLVFNCDGSFDFKGMGRFFTGLCQAGAWGCFDEFNRLDERILSAVSQQIQTIQEALKVGAKEVTLDSRTVPLNRSMGIFVTMNPEYSGRSKLPDNLKMLFRPINMTRPDKESIAEIMLFAQGFKTAERMSKKIVPFFELCNSQLSRQPHYDFGLRALKSVLINSGILKHRVFNVNGNENENKTMKSSTDIEENETTAESQLITQSLLDTILPKLTAEDAEFFHFLLRDVFPGESWRASTFDALRKAICDICDSQGYVAEDAWIEKVLQLYKIMQVHHGVMLVGSSGSGKSTAWTALLKSLAKVENVNCYAHVINPKTLKKSELFGSLDPTTREWKDGVFTSIFRSIVLNDIKDEDIVTRGEGSTLNHSNDSNNCNIKKNDNIVKKRHWIIFDGDVDPEWVESLNSLLDDNRILSLANGERLPLLPYVSIVFETHSLKYATPATVSRCGMVWFNDRVVSERALLHKHLFDFQTRPFTERTVGMFARQARYYFEKDTSLPLAEKKKKNGSFLNDEKKRSTSALSSFSNKNSQHTDNNDNNNYYYYSKDERKLLDVQKRLVSAMDDNIFCSDGFVEKMLFFVRIKYRDQGIMEFNLLHNIQAFFALLAHAAIMIRQHEEEYNAKLSPEVLAKFANKRVLYGVLWGFAGDLGMKNRELFAEELRQKAFLVLGAKEKYEDILQGGGGLLDYEVRVYDGSWLAIRDAIPETEISAMKVGMNDVVIPTMDIKRHEDIIFALLETGFPAILAGPVGSGKSMTLSSILARNTHKYEIASLNFSSNTNPETVIKTLEQYCTISHKNISTEAAASGDGEGRVRANFGINSASLVMSPPSGKTLVVFCDEINLPREDHYETQCVTQLLRQLIERRGFYRSRDNAWVTVQNVQFVGACNPPTDPGRVSLSHRFLRWAPVLFVDFPTYDSLLHIYQTYCRAILSTKLTLRPLAFNLAKAMISFFQVNQEHFTTEMQNHYVYSPRELSRWSRAIFEGIQAFDEMQQGAMMREMAVEDLIRLAVHEGLRLFADRLVTDEEKKWVDTAIDDVFTDSFKGIDLTEALKRPIFFSTIISRYYTSCSRELLKKHIKGKLRSFSEEELDVKLVVFDSLIDHVVRIDRAFRQSLCHILIVGSSGVGKAIITRFVAWMNNLHVFQIKAHQNYTLNDFENDLRTVLKRAGCHGERICFIFEESNILESSFLEYMNSLLACGEIPGLFDGEEWGKLMNEIRDGIESNNNNNNKDINGSVPLEELTTIGDSVKKKKIYGGKRFNIVDVNSEADLYKWFVSSVREHLHVAFTMNPDSVDFTGRAAKSPALFNRCTIDWFGDWSVETTFQVARELTEKIDVLTAFAGRQINNEVAHDILAHCLHNVHTSVRTLSERHRRDNSHHIGTYITPRHFLDFVRHFCFLYRQKQTESEELFGHLSTGVKKLAETSIFVDEQNESLIKKEKILADAAQKSQVMLESIISETDMSKRRREEVSALQAQLEVESRTLQEHRAIVSEQLTQAEPALEDAAIALNTVKPEQLREIRNYATPPATVKKVLEAVVTVLGEKQTSWDFIKNYTRKEDFIPQIKAFKPELISEEVRMRVKNIFMSDPVFTYENAQRASKAAGPLQKWVVAQVNYSEIFKSVLPLREEADRLSVTYEVKKARQEQVEQELSEIEVNIGTLKRNYQDTMSEISKIEQEVKLVSCRCERAIALLRNLRVECIRWKEQMESFKGQMPTMLGDCLISAAFLAYIGYFGEWNRRNELLPEWFDIADAAQIRVSNNMVPLEYLSTAEERLQWKTHRLPQDGLYIENAILLLRNTNRFPLIIDPTGQAVDFLLSMLKSKKIANTGMLDRGMLKQVEMAIRFGYPILIENAEHINPVLKPLLNREIRKIGGRHLVRLGSQDIDVAPTFQLFLSSRDSSFQFPPDICGRVNIVNFAVTRFSLERQCLHKIMTRERPDVEENRMTLVEAREAYRTRLHSLERELLEAIADAEGSILENDNLIKTLETLKTEAAEVQNRIDNSENDYHTIITVEAFYEPVASVCSNLYFFLRDLLELSAMYNFSVRFIFSILGAALDLLEHEAGAASSSTSGKRISLLLFILFNLAHQRIIRSLFERDHLCFELKLAQFRCTVKDDVGKQIPAHLWNLLLRSSGDSLPEQTAKAGAVTVPSGYTNNNLRYAVDLMSSSAVPTVLAEAPLRTVDIQALVSLMDIHRFFANVCSSMENERSRELWKNFLGYNINDIASGEKTKLDRMAFLQNQEELAASPSILKLIPSDAFPHEWSSPAQRMFFILILCKILRKDLFAAAAQGFLKIFFAKPTLKDENFEGDDGWSPLVESGSTTTETPTAAIRSISPSEEKKHTQGALSFFTTDRGASLLSVENAAKELAPDIPLLVVASAGYDVSNRIEMFARASNKSMAVVTMGSPEGFEIANGYIAQGMRLGSWVFLKNIHLATSAYLSKVEMWIHREQLENRIHNDFRIFLSCEPNEHIIPVCLISASLMMVFESTPGVKNTLLRTLKAIPRNFLNQPPMELPRLYFITAWLHTVIRERLNFPAVGWSTFYEFSEVDFRRSVSTIYAWVQSVREERMHVPPEELPWTAMARLVALTVYGGRVDNEFDQLLLDGICDRFIRAEAFEVNFDFSLSAAAALGGAMDKEEGLKSSLRCDGVAMKDFFKWAESIPDSSVDSPRWLGLPDSAPSTVLTHRANDILQRLAKVQSVLPDELSEDKRGEQTHKEDFSSGGGPIGISEVKLSNRLSHTRHRTLSVSTTISQYSSMMEKKLFIIKEAILDKLPTEISLVRGEDKVISASFYDGGGVGVEKNVFILDPRSALAPTLAREVKMINLVRHSILSDIDSVISACNSDKSINRQLHLVMDAIQKDTVPQSWSSLLSTTNAVLANITNLKLWLMFFGESAQLLTELIHTLTESSNKVEGKGSLSNVVCNIGHLFYPGGFITGIRQHVARHENVSIESLFLSLKLYTVKDLSRIPSAKETEVTLTGLRLCSAVLLEEEKDKNETGIVGSSLLTLKSFNNKDKKDSSNNNTRGTDNAYETNKMITRIHLARLTFVPQEEEPYTAKKGSHGKKSQKPVKTTAVFPWYLDAGRTTFLGSVCLPVDPRVPKEMWCQQGCCFLYFNGDV